MHIFFIVLLFESIAYLIGEKMFASLCSLDVKILWVSKSKILVSCNKIKSFPQKKSQ